MGHLGDGALRRLIDEPLAMSDSERFHYQHCEHCQARRREYEAQAESAGQLLAVGPAEVDTQAALRAVTARSAHPASASGVGAADYCVRESVKYARERVTFGKPLAERQAIQWPLVELATDVQLLRTFVRKTASEMDDAASRVAGISDKVSMCNFRANRLVCEAADRAMQVHGGLGYTRHKPFEHIYRHHRRYRITEGSEEIQKRKVAGFLFGYMGAGKH